MKYQGVKIEKEKIQVYSLKSTQIQVGLSDLFFSVTSISPEIMCDMVSPDTCCQCCECPRSYNYENGSYCRGPCANPICSTHMEGLMSLVTFEPHNSPIDPDDWPAGSNVGEAVDSRSYAKPGPILLASSL